MTKCRHFLGAQHATCAAGLPLPRICAGICVPANLAQDFTQPSPCPGFALRTAEEEEERQRLIDALVVQMNTARAAIVEHTKGARGRVGRMACPICKKPGESLAFRVALNGHIAASCQTVACVNWIE